MKPKVSICIPTYNMHRGIEYLDYSLSIIAQQSYQPIEVVISDHSLDAAIQNLCEMYKSTIDILYIKNKENRGSSSANLNNAVKNSTGELIRVLFQDDFLLNKFSIENHVNSLLSSDARWSITACMHYEDDSGLIDPHNPFFNHDILFTNTLSSPSTLLVYKDSYMEFDRNLLYYMDTDVYKRLYCVYGLPDICGTANVANRRHANQVTNTLVDSGVIQTERDYLKNKHHNE